jgi:hypothetical protein
MSYALNEKRVGKEAVNLVGRLLRKWIWKQNWVSLGILLFISCKEWHPIYSEVLCQYFWTFSGPPHIYDVCLLLQFTPKHCADVTLMLKITWFLCQVVCWLSWQFLNAFCQSHQANASITFWMFLSKLFNSSSTSHSTIRAVQCVVLRAS